MSEPESDYGAVDSILEKVHGGRVSQYVWTDFLPLERCTRSRGEGGVFGDETLNRITAELSTTGTEKQRIFRTATAVAQPGVQHLCRFWPKRCAPMFSALSLTMHMGAGSQDDILACQPNQLGNAKPSLHREQKHGPIATPNPTGGIRGRQQSVDLFPIEEFDGPALMTFRGHRKYSLAEQRMGGFLENHILEEGVNRSQADVPGASAILPASFKILE